MDRVLAGLLILGTILVAPIRAVGGEPASPARAMDTVKAYSKAYMQLEVETVSKLSHPILIARAGGIEPYRHRVRELFETFKPLQFDKGIEILGTASDMFIDGKTMMVGIPAIRKAPGIATAPFVYVAVSYDAGKTWSVLGLQCTDEKWLRGVAPGYQGRPDILGRANPAVVAMEAGRDLDEEDFLKGARWTTRPK